MILKKDLPVLFIYIYVLVWCFLSLYGFFAFTSICVPNFILFYDNPALYVTIVLVFEHNDIFWGFPYFLFKQVIFS